MITNYCTLDFETRSSAPIQKGLQAYFADPNFSVICGAFKFKGKKPVAFYEEQTEKMCKNLLKFAQRHPLLSFNTAFEAGVFSKLTGLDYFEAFKLFFPVELAVKFLGGPDNLNRSASFFDIEKGKDPIGKYLIDVMSVPMSENTPDLEKWKKHANKKGFIDHPTLFKGMLKYCKQDVVVTTSIFEKVKQYIPEMKKAGAFEGNMLNFLRNNHGIRFNQQKTEKLHGIVKELELKVKERGKEIMKDGNFNINSSQQIKKVFQDFNLEDTQAQSLKPIRERVASNLKELIDLRLNRPSGVSAVLPKVSESCDKDGVVYNCYRFWGAGQTGRFKSYHVNPLTWPRTSYSLDESVKLLTTEDELYGKRLKEGFSAVKNTMRSCIIPKKGCTFFGGDFSQIEFRLLMLCCGDLKRLNMLYRGWDGYKYLASKVYNKHIDKVTKDERYIAKRVTLALGYGMGVLKAQNILFAEGIFVKESVIKSIFTAYRQAFPLVTRFSEKLEESFNGKYLRIPFSGRKIHLFNCKRMVGEYGSFWVYKNENGGMTGLAKHKMTGWVIQGLACDIFRAVLLNLYKELGLVTDLPFHDEVLCSVPLEKGKPVVDFKDFKRVLGQSPDFIKKHLPYIQTETWKGGYYGK